MNVENIKNEEYSRTLKVISLCSVCGEPVRATKYDKALRHGFKRYKKSINQGSNTSKRFSQEDDKPCSGTGEEVVYKRCGNYKRRIK